VVAEAQTTLVNGRRYLRAPVPVRFPEEEFVPEGGLHFELRAGLFLILHGEFAGRAWVGSDQFVYWDPTDPKRCVAPDVMIRLGAPDIPVPSWKVWEGGAPHVAVEMVSPSDRTEGNWPSRLERYQRSGIQELVRFDNENPESPLELWDRLDADLVERDLAGASIHPSDVLGLFWCVIPDARLGRMLRLSRDEAGSDLVQTPEERALARIAELEAELQKR
jgi:hypothetical protein